MYIYIYVYTRSVYIYIYMYTHGLCIYIYVYTRSVYIYIYVYTRSVYIYIYVYTRSVYIYICIHTVCVYIYMYTHGLCIYIYMYTHGLCIYIYMYTHGLCIYIYIHAYAHTQKQTHKIIDRNQHRTFLCYSCNAPSCTCRAKWSPPTRWVSFGAVEVVQSLDFGISWDLGNWSCHAKINRNIPMFIILIHKTSKKSAQRSPRGDRGAHKTRAATLHSWHSKNMDELWLL